MKVKSYTVLLSSFFYCFNAYSACPALGNTLNAPTGVSSDSNCIVSVSGGSFGIVVNANSQYTSINGTVSTVGNGGYGVVVIGSNASLLARGLVVSTTGSFVPNHYALGLLLQPGVNATIDDRVSATRASSIRTSGQGSTAVVMGPNSSFTVHGASQPVYIGTSANGANGIQMESGSMATVNNLLMETSGVGSFGIHMYGASAPAYQGTNNTIRTFGDDANILNNHGGGVMTFQDSVLTSTGENSYGMISRSDVNSSNLTLTHSILETEKATAFYLTGAALTSINLKNGTEVTPGNGVLIDAYTNANVVFNAENGVVLSGDAHADNGSTVNMTLVGSTWTGAAFDVNTLALTGSEWLLTQSSNIRDSITNAGLIDFGGSEAFKILTTANYEGNNGILKMRTELNSDNDSSTDRLVIDGGLASGTTNIMIENKGGMGAKTVGDGILIVDAVNGGSTEPTSFSQQTSAIAGAYRYKLYRGDLDGSNPDNWYLRSRLIIDPVEPIDPDDPDPVVSEFRRQISLYNSIMPIAALYGRQVIDSLHQRVGEEELLRNRSNLGKSRFANGVWGRVIGLQGRWSGDYYGPYQGAPKSKYDFGAGQLGIDLYRSEGKAKQRDHIGIYGVYGQATENLDHKGLADVYVGSDQFRAYSLAGYWTHYGESGWYLDGVVQGTYYDNTVKINLAAIPSFVRHNSGVNPGEWGAAVSLEGGYPIPLNKTWVLEPQAQVVYQNISLNNFYDGSAHVQFQDLSSVAGRLGGRLVHGGYLGFKSNKKEYKAWIRANAWREFSAKPATEFLAEDGLVAYGRSLKENWGQFGVGADVMVSSLCSLYGSFDYQRTFLNNAYSYEGKIGLRSNW